MEVSKVFDVIIVGGSYSGLSAAMALGRSLRTVLIIDSGEPCNRQTPYSHNFLTRDGETPAAIAAIAREQVAHYKTVQFLNDKAVKGFKAGNLFTIETASGQKISAVKLIFATGIRDMLADIKGLSECWGISVLHCPYCHGYEVKDVDTGILMNGEMAYEFSLFIYNWSTRLTLFTNGDATLTEEQRNVLSVKGIKVNETRVKAVIHRKGHIEALQLSDGSSVAMQALYAPAPFKQHCDIPEQLGCILTDEGYIQTDELQKTSVAGVYACGDSTTRLRTIANAVARGATAGMMLNRELVMAVV